MKKVYDCLFNVLILFLLVYLLTYGRAPTRVRASQLSSIVRLLSGHNVHTFQTGASGAITVGTSNTEGDYEIICVVVGQYQVREQSRILFKQCQEPRSSSQ